MQDNGPSNQHAAQANLVTIGDMVGWCQRQFEEAELCFGHGTDNARDESAALVMYCLELPYDLPESGLAGLVSEADQRRILALADRRVSERKPLAYLTREALFAGQAFYVDPRVLVPRSPIAELIEEGFRPWLVSGDGPGILDLCTGSGCIAVACAYALPRCRVDASDISAEALQVAAINIEKHGLGHRIKATESDLFDNLQGRKYDLIVSNPPYVRGDELISLPFEYRAEPDLGFAGGKDGIEIITRILAAAADHLEDQGILVVEAGSSSEKLIDAFPEVPFLWLDFERGGDGVFLLAARQVRRFQPRFKAAVDARCPATA